jgi:copper(I)-binding protein
MGDSMKKLRNALILTLTLAASVSARQAASDAWIAEPAAGDTTAVAYLTVTNPTAYDIYVVSASSSAAERVEIRQGAGAAEKVVKVITVSSYGFAELKPSEEHLVLVNLKRPLKTGDTVDLTLKTDGGITLNVSAAVKGK